MNDRARYELEFLHNKDDISTDSYEMLLTVFEERDHLQEVLKNIKKMAKKEQLVAETHTYWLSLFGRLEVQCDEALEGPE